MGGCSPSFPAERFPHELGVKRTLFSGGDILAFRETCQATIVEITDETVNKLIRIARVDGKLVNIPPPGWHLSPMILKPSEPSYFKGAFGGCADYGKPLGDVPGALEREGAYYEIINGGEGLAVIVPRAKLAAFYYFG